jgi:hypothetical protein
MFIRVGGTPKTREAGKESTRQRKIVRWRRTCPPYVFSDLVPKGYQQNFYCIDV